MSGAVSEKELVEFLESLKGLEGLSAVDIACLRGMAVGELEVALPKEFEEEKAGPQQEVVDEEQERDLRAKLPGMTIPEKIKMALFGSWLCRAILVMDANRIVQNCVLRSPRLREGEVETFAKNPNVSELVLREISKSRTWMKSYALKLGLVTNPKTPGDVALKWIHFLVKADLRKIAATKNLPQLVTVNARKLVADMEKKKG